jgi:sterol desaturase/sphingolipid hydroxylase (fatty acid hydroxylase superfamily)
MVSANAIELWGPVFIITAILLLESVFPAQKQRPISDGFIQDSIWFLGDYFVRLLILAPYSHFLISTIAKFKPQNLVEWDLIPIVFRLIIAVLLADFLAWVAHIAMHKVPVLWNFHAIHHSQGEMNLFTDKRVHIVEYLAVYAIVLIPMRILEIPIVDAFLYVFFQQWYLIVYHANLRSNYGFLRYFMVTPQSHRIHHSLNAEHHDKNFGVMFSIWDRLFQTQYLNSRDYPKTGVIDFQLSPAIGSSLPKKVGHYITQNIYPFRTLLQSFK